MLIDVREFVFEHHYKQIALIYKNRYYLLKKNGKKRFRIVRKKITDPTKAKEYYQLFVKNKNKKSKNSDLKYVTIKHATTASNSLKAIK